MPTLFDQISSITGGSGISEGIAGQAGQLGNIASLVQGFIDSPPGDFSGLLDQLSGTSAPKVSVGDGLSQLFASVLPSLQSQLGGLLGPVQGAAGSLRDGATGDLSEVLGAVLEIIQSLQRLLASDWSAGLIPGFGPEAPPAAPGGDPGEPGGGGPAEPGSPGSGSSAALSVVTPEHVTAAQAFLDELPADFSVPALLGWIHARVGTVRPAGIALRFIPLVDDLRDPLDTLVRWQQASQNELVAELGATIGTLRGIVDANGAGVIPAALPSSDIGALELATLGTRATALAVALDALSSAVENGAAQGIQDAILAAEAARAALVLENTAFQAQSALIAGLIQKLDALPSGLEAAVGRLIVLAQPRASLGSILERIQVPGGEEGGLVPVALPLPDENTFAPVREALERVQEFLNNVLGLLDVSSVTGPVEDALGTVRDGIQTLEQKLAELTAAARSVFEQAQATLSTLGLDSVLQQAEQALGGVTDQIQVALESVLGPAATALDTGLGAIDSALGAFDVETLTAPVQGLIEQLEAVFESAEVQQILAALGQLDELAAQLDELSFQPVADTVIGGIGDIKGALQSIGPNLPDPMPGLIREAMSVLPRSLTPLIDPLTDGIDTLIDEGPIPLLEALRDLPQPIIENLRNFSPRGLLEEPLGAPFRTLREKLDEFEPTHWLDAAEEELDALKQRLLDSLDISGLLAPLVSAFQALLDELARFRPGVVLEPLAHALEEAVHAVAGALPSADLLSGLDSVLDRIQSFVGTLGAAADLARAFADKVELLTEPEAQVQAWLGGILDKLPAAPSSAIGTALGELSQAVASTRAAPLAAAYASARAPLATKLVGVDAALLSRLLVGRSQLLARVASVQDADARTALSTWLGAFDPAGAALSLGLSRVAGLRDALSRADSAVPALLAGWDARYHAPEGALAQLAVDSVDMADLRGWLLDAAQRQLGAPVSAFFKAVRAAGGILGTFVDALAALLESIEQKLNDVLGVPIAIRGIAEELDSLKERLLAVDLDVFVHEIDALYTTLLEQLRALDPRALAAPLRQSLERLLDGLSLDSVINPALRRHIEETYAALKAKVDSLDPELLIIAPLDALYTERILPAVEALDVGESIQTVIDRLNELPDELRAELGRVDDAYTDMLNAAPAGTA